jgi:hypothetical protein
VSADAEEALGVVGEPEKVFVMSDGKASMSCAV